MRIYIGLGSNVGDRMRHLKNAAGRIAQLPGVRRLRLSSIYETEPVQCGGGRFYNAVLEIESAKTPHEILSELKAIETVLGRVSVQKGEPRVIDLDLLTFGTEMISGPDLTVPHPRMHERRFVLEPLCELDSGLWHPILKKTAGQILAQLKDEVMAQKVKR